MAAFCKWTVACQAAIEMGLRNVVQLFTGHVRPVEWNSLVHSHLGDMRWVPGMMKLSGIIALSPKLAMECLLS